MNPIEISSEELTTSREQETQIPSSENFQACHHSSKAANKAKADEHHKGQEGSRVENEKWDLYFKTKQETVHKGV